MVATISARGASVRVAKLLHHFELHGQPLPVLDVMDLEAGEVVTIDTGHVVAYALDINFKMRRALG